MADAPAARPFDRGTYTLDGYLLTQVTSDDSEGCAEPTTDEDGNEVMKGGTGIYEIALSEDGDTLSLEKVEDECYFRAQDYAQGMTRHSSD